MKTFEIVVGVFLLGFSAIFAYWGGADQDIVLVVLAVCAFALAIQNFYVGFEK